MNFTLCYKDYDYEITLEACKLFAEKNKDKCLLSVIEDNYTAYTQAKKEKDYFIQNTIMNNFVPKHLVIDALYCLAKVKNSQLTYHEIFDACLRTSTITADDGKNARCNLVLATIGADYYSSAVSKDKKKV